MEIEEKTGTDETIQPEEKPKKKRRVLRKTLIIITALVAAAVLTAVICFAYFFGRSDYKRDEDVSRLTISEIRSAADSADSKEAEAIRNLADEEDVLTESERELLREQQYAVKLPENKDIYNILLVGLDSRKETRSYGNSDTMMLISIDSSKKVIHMTSFMRDLYAIVPGYGGRKLNSAHALGAGPLLVQTIEENWKIPVDNYASVNFEVMVKVVDAIGGVDLDIKEEELKYVNIYIRQLCSYFRLKFEKHKIMSAGRQHCDGVQALGYMRVRAVGFDYARTQRQRNVVQAIMKKLKTLNVAQIMSLADQILPSVTHNLDQARVFTLLSSAPAILTYRVEESRVPFDGLYYSYNQNLICDFTATIARLHHEIYEYEIPEGLPEPVFPGGKEKQVRFPRGYHGILEENRPAV